jgi:HAD superfamily hydrolase (TIGR01484 family)
MSMSPIQSLSPHISENLMGIFFDVDDTFTSHGKIESEAFQALWAAKKAGLLIVPITGRPAGWCDHIARMWPIDGVVGENGAFYFWYDGAERKLRKRFMDTEEIRKQRRTRLEKVKKEILASVHGAALAGDQLYRETDLAIDYSEDVPPLPWEDVERICAIFKKHGAICKVSSIHVNGWFGTYGKLDMTKILARELWGLDLDQEQDRFFFCGDSPNDEPMFAHFPHSAGVKNISRFTKHMKHLPTYITNREGGRGFVEIVGTILDGRKDSSGP